MKKLTDIEIEEKYKEIGAYHKKYLKNKGIKLPHLKWGGKYTEKALALICLSENYPNTKPVSKEELTEFIHAYRPDLKKDIQAGRHLGKQEGFYITTGTRGDSKIEKGSYKLETLEKTFPKFNPDRRGASIDDTFWRNLKKQYNYRCACCGSREGEPHRYNSCTITKLQKGHKNPNLPLDVKNIIPQCQICNQPDLNNWEYNDEGRVIGIAKAEVIDRCPNELKKEIFKLLKIFFGE